MVNVVPATDGSANAHTGNRRLLYQDSLPHPTTPLGIMHYAEVELFSPRPPQPPLLAVQLAEVFDM